MSSAKLLTPGGGGVILQPASSIAADVTVNVPVSGVNGGTLVSTDASGNVGIGTASPTAKLSVEGSVLVAKFKKTVAGGVAEFQNGNDAGYGIAFLNSSGGSTGSITWTATTTAYNTSSDYRLKENIAPMTGALAKVQQLKPVTYTWKADGSDGEGFIAHELAEVVPQCVTGEKDAVDAEGKPVYQGIDTSFLVATLTAAIKEQQAMIQTLQAEVADLKSKVQA